MEVSGRRGRFTPGEISPVICDAGWADILTRLNAGIACCYTIQNELPFQLLASLLSVYSLVLGCVKEVKFTLELEGE